MTVPKDAELQDRYGRLRAQIIERIRRYLRQKHFEGAPKPHHGSYREAKEQRDREVDRLLAEEGGQLEREIDKLIKTKNANITDSIAAIARRIEVRVDGKEKHEDNQTKVAEKRSERQTQQVAQRKRRGQAALLMQTEETTLSPEVIAARKARAARAARQEELAIASAIHSNSRSRQGQSATHIVGIARPHPQPQPSPPKHPPLGPSGRTNQELYTTMNMESYPERPLVDQTELRNEFRELNLVDNVKAIWPRDKGESTTTHQGEFKPLSGDARRSAVRRPLDTKFALERSKVVIGLNPALEGAGEAPAAPAVGEAVRADHRPGTREREGKWAWDTVGSMKAGERKMLSQVDLTRNAAGEVLSNERTTTTQMLNFQPPEAGSYATRLRKCCMLDGRKATDSSSVFEFGYTAAKKDTRPIAAQGSTLSRRDARMLGMEGRSGKPLRKRRLRGAREGGQPQSDAHTANGAPCELSVEGREWKEGTLKTTAQASYLPYQYVGIDDLTPEDRKGLLSACQDQFYPKCPTEPPANAVKMRG